MARDFTFFLGGHDLEMVTIGQLVRGVLGADRVVDDELRWGATASVYAKRIAVVLEAGGTAVLIELKNDLPRRFAETLTDDGRIVLVDHHDERAGADKPSALCQVFDLLGLPERRWTRRLALVAANDVRHMEGLRQAGARPNEIRAIRDADRAAQGVTARDEQLGRQALAAARLDGGVLVVRTPTERSSPILDYLEPEYGGAGHTDVLVRTPSTVEFYGDGRVIATLTARFPRAWRGGALPARGFWGLTTTSELTFRRCLAVTRRALAARDS